MNWCEKYHLSPKEIPFDKLRELNTPNSSLLTPHFLPFP